MKYLRRTTLHTLLNHKRNEEILEELHVTPSEDKLCTYRHKWFQHVHRMEDNRLPKQLLNYHPKGRRQPGRPLKRLLDDMTADTETGHPGLNSWWNMMMIFFVCSLYYFCKGFASLYITMKGVRVVTDWPHTIQPFHKQSIMRRWEGLWKIIHIQQKCSLDQWYSTGGTRRHLRGYVKLYIYYFI
jgi:hypothetical protein